MEYDSFEHICMHAHRSVLTLKAEPDPLDADVYNLNVLYIY